MVKIYFSNQAFLLSQTGNYWSYWNLWRAPINHVDSWRSWGRGFDKYLSTLLQMSYLVKVSTNEGESQNTQKSIHVVYGCPLLEPLAQFIDFKCQWFCVTKRLCTPRLIPTIRCPDVFVRLERIFPTLIQKHAHLKIDIFKWVLFSNTIVPIFNGNNAKFC